MEFGDNWGVDHSIWATEDEYINWNASNYNTTTTTTRDRDRDPPNKKTRTSQSQSQSQSQTSANANANANGVDDPTMSRSKAIGKMFYKTKLCCKFRAGVCPYITNCNFAHGLEELRKPPPNWQDIVSAAAHEDPFDQEQHQIPTISTADSRLESHRSYKGRHCKKFYTEEGCPYGDTCTFLHDEQSRARESVAISVSPSLAPPPSATIPSPSPSSSSSANPASSINKPSNWKTRICNKWETTGSCPFGTKCHFAHGLTAYIKHDNNQIHRHIHEQKHQRLSELHKYGGGLMDGEGGRDSSVPTETKQTSVAIKTADPSVSTSLIAPRQEFHQVGLVIPSQRPSSVTQVVGQRPLQKWKGPDKISRIYGDWIDDFE